MEQGKIGDRISMESERIGQSAREGVIQEVLGAGDNSHYRVRWDDGHESTFYPTAGTTRIISKAKKVAAR
ncbi:MAG TPA: DUF1918 domain-containing protein [Candidatus Dormibacteraeota bacterium]|nr:DUF1918 domain-containing protein [Candidatus Dormibacteraeota bacterium]